MIVDASALSAVLLGEPERNAFRAKIAECLEPVMSPFNHLEAAVGADKYGGEIAVALDKVVKELEIAIVPATTPQAFLAREAHKKFGKGNHPAKLNLGDCVAYALAKARSERLLFKGDDYRQTDVEAAL